MHRGQGGVPGFSLFSCLCPEVPALPTGTLTLAGADHLATEGSRIAGSGHDPVPVLITDDDSGDALMVYEPVAQIGDYRCFHLVSDGQRARPRIHVTQRIKRPPAA